MGPLTIGDRIMALIASVAWRVFLWANRVTEEEYWRQNDAARDIVTKGG